MNNQEIAQWMREGAAMVPWTTAMVTYDQNNQAKEACAIGCVLIVGDSEHWKVNLPTRYTSLFYQSLARHLDAHYAVHPESLEVETLFEIIADLNDIHEWDRTAIADWLEHVNTTSKVHNYLS